MSTLASALHGEISRLATKEARKQVAPIRTTTSSLRKQVFALKKQLQEIQREVLALKRQAARTKPETEPAQETKFRFTAKGFRSMRGRLGLSAEDCGRLLGVSQQSVYNWEAGKTQPQRAQIPLIAAIRNIGKREARARLDAAGTIAN